MKKPNPKGSASSSKTKMQLYTDRKRAENPNYDTERAEAAKKQREAKAAAKAAEAAAAAAAAEAAPPATAEVATSPPRGWFAWPSSSAGAPTAAQQQQPAAGGAPVAGVEGR